MGEVIWNKETYNELIVNLKNNADEKYRDFTLNLNPGKEKIIGIRIPELRKKAAEISKGDWRKFLDISYKNDKGYIEEEFIRGLVIGNVKNCDIEEFIDYVDDFIGRIDSWSVNDTFCSSLKITKKNMDRMHTFILDNLKSKNPWRKRFSIVMLMDYYLSEEYLDEIFDICDTIKDDEYYYKMAVAWLLSMCFVKFRDRTMAYFTSCNLDDFTYNKALQKTRESLRVSKEDKETLKEMKRKTVKM